MKESIIGSDIQIEMSKTGVRLFRNNIGTLRDRNGTYVTYGLCNGSSDYIGWKSIEVTAEMIGRKLAIFVACEVKQPGKKATQEQKNFIAAVNFSGGIGVVVTSVKEAVDSIR